MMSDNLVLSIQALIKRWEEESDIASKGNYEDWTSNVMEYCIDELKEVLKNERINIT